MKNLIFLFIFLSATTTFAQIDEKSEVYKTAIPNNDFCSALITLMNDASSEFIHLRDSSGTDKFKFPSKVIIPGAISANIYHSMGYYVSIKYKDPLSREAETQAVENLTKQLKECFPGYYFETEKVDENKTLVHIGNTYDNGYESEILELKTWQSDSVHYYNYDLKVIGDQKFVRYHTISTSAQDNSFATSLRKIYDDTPNEFRNVKGKAHTEGGGMFQPGHTSYDLNPQPDSAISCRFPEPGKPACNCLFYNGDNHADAVDLYNHLVEKVKNALGSEFTYTYSKPESSSTITENSESHAIFAIKATKHATRTPCIIVQLVKSSSYESGKYLVQILFGKEKV